VPVFVMAMNKTLRLFLLLFALLLLGENSEAQEVTQTSVIVMVDISGSFFPLAKDSKTALKRVADALINKSTREWDTPVSFLWSTIGNPLDMIYPCGQAIQFDPSKIFSRGKDPLVKTRIEEVQNWHEVCLKIFSGKRIKPNSKTMLSGSINIAAQSAEMIPGLKVLVLLSDFKEALPENKSPSVFKLNNEVVILLYGLHKSDEGDDQKARIRAEQWEDKIIQSGARMVCKVPIRALQPGRIMQCLNTI